MAKRKPKKTIWSTIGAVALALIAWYAHQQGWIDLEQSEQRAPAPPPTAREHEPRVTKPSQPSSSNPTVTAEDDGGIGEAFRQGRSDLIVETAGVVERVLPDDNEGDRHQRFIVALPGGTTVLIAHNIDLAPRVPLREGDRVRFKGEYEWNDRGGVVHWTHHDPRHRRPGGWIEHAGKRYE